MANSLGSLNSTYWAERMHFRLYRERGYDVYIEMKRRMYAEEDRAFAQRQRILMISMVALLVLAYFL